MKNFKFYDKKEVDQLRDIKSLPTKKERTAALTEFCKTFNRGYAAAYCKMKGLNKRANLAAVPASGAFIGNSCVVIKINSIVIKDGTMYVNY